MRKKCPKQNPVIIERVATTRSLAEVKLTDVSGADSEKTDQNVYILLGYWLPAGLEVYGVVVRRVFSPPQNSPKSERRSAEGETLEPRPQSEFGRVQRSCQLLGKVKLDAVQVFKAQNQALDQRYQILTSRNLIYLRRQPRMRGGKPQEEIGVSFKRSLFVALQEVEDRAGQLATLRAEEGE